MLLELEIYGCKEKMSIYECIYIYLISTYKPFIIYLYVYYQIAHNHALPAPKSKDAGGGQKKYNIFTTCNAILLWKEVITSNNNVSLHFQFLFFLKRRLIKHFAQQSNMHHQIILWSEKNDLMKNPNLKKWEVGGRKVYLVLLISIQFH